MSLFVLCLFCLLLNGTLGFVVFPASRFHLTSARNAVPQYQASNSFVLVRRDAPAGVNQQKSEIFVPKNENKDRKSVGVVVSVPSEVTILRSGDTVIVEVRKFIVMYDSMTPFIILYSHAGSMGHWTARFC